MNKSVRFSPCNPLRFVKKDTSLPGAYGQAPYGQATYLQSLRPWQQQLPYLQKIQRGDLVSFQLHVQEGCTNAEPQLFDHNGNYLATVYAQSQLTVPGNRTPDGAQYVTLQYLFIPESVPQLNGKEFIYIQVLTSWGTGIANDYYISEPVWLRDKHPDTVLAEYSNTQNDYDTIFEQITPVFRMRVPSLGLSLKMGNEYTTFENQNKELSKLTARSYRNYNWEIGGRTGVPDYVADRISHALNCDFVSIDGRQYRKEDGAELEAAGEEGAPLQFYHILLREASHQSSYTYGVRDVLLWQRPSSGFPYALFEVHLTNGYINLYSGAKVYDNAAQELELINAWAAQAGVMGIRGEFISDSVNGTYYYRQAEGENFTATQPQLFTRFMFLELSLAPFVNSFKYAFSGGSHVFDPGPGLGSQYHASQTVAYVGYNYFASTAYARIFHDGSMLSFKHTGDGFQYITNIGGTAPALLQSLDLFGEDFSALPALSLDFLKYCDWVFASLRIRNSKLNAIANGWTSSTSPLIPHSMKKFKRLGDVQLDLNNFNTGNVDAFINTFEKGTGYPSRGYFNIKLQSPAAPPSSSLASITKLRNAGWTVLTD